MNHFAKIATCVGAMLVTSCVSNYYQGRDVSVRSFCVSGTSACLKREAVTYNLGRNNFQYINSDEYLIRGNLSSFSPQSLVSCKKNNSGAIFYEVFTIDNWLYFAHTTNMTCEINKELTLNKVSEIDTDRESVEISRLQKIKEDREYKNSENFADNVFEQIGIDRALAQQCLKYNITSYSDFKKYDDSAVSYAKEITGQRYSEDKMNFGLARANGLLKGGYISLSYDYCKAISLGGEMYKRF